jgi:hypothetical protein
MTFSCAKCLLENIKYYLGDAPTNDLDIARIPDGRLLQTSIGMKFSVLTKQLILITDQ